MALELPKDYDADSAEPSVLDTTALAARPDDRAPEMVNAMHELDRALSNADDLTSELADTVATLEKRIGMALRPPPPGDDVAGGIPESRAYSSELAKAVSERALTVQRITQRLVEIRNAARETIDRVEL